MPEWTRCQEGLVSPRKIFADRVNDPPPSIVDVHEVMTATEPTFEVLFETHRARVFNFCLRMVANRDSAEDLTQEIFAKALERAELPEPRWIYAVARNACLDFLRRQKGWNAAWGRLVGWLGPQARDGYRVEADLVQRHEGLRILQQLSPRYRELLILKNYLGLSYEEMAAVLGTTPRSIGPMLHRANAQAANIVRREASTDAL